MKRNYIKYKKPVRWMVLMAMLGIYIAGAMAQQPFIRWQTCNINRQEQKKYGVCSYEGGYFVGRDGILTNINTWGNKDIVVSRYDSTGGLIWEKSYGGSGNEIVLRMRDLDKDRCLVLGTTNSTDGDIQSGNKGKYDIWVFVIDTAGQILWEKTYGGPEEDYPVEVIVLEDKSFIVAANIIKAGGDIDTAYGDYDIWLFRCDSMGNMLWQKTLGAEGTNIVTGFIVNDKGNLVLTGANSDDYFSGCYYPPNQSIILLEYDMQADKILWNRCYGSWQQDYGGEVIQYGEGYVFAGSVGGDGEYVEGYHQNPFSSSFYYDIWLVRTDGQGFIEWKKCLGGTHNDRPIALFGDSAGNIYLFGNTQSLDYDVHRLHGNDGFNNDIWMLKLSGGGEILFNRTYGGSSGDVISGHGAVYMRRDEKGFVLAAASQSQKDGDVECELPYWYLNLWLFEIDRCNTYEPGTPLRPAGDTLVYTLSEAETEYQIVSADNAWMYDWKLVPQEAGELSNLGLRARIRWNKEYQGQARLKVRAQNVCGMGSWSEHLVIHVEQAYGKSEAELIGVRLYPNPTRGEVKMQLPSPGPYHIIVSDVRGSELRRLEAPAGDVQYDMSDLEPGVYLYRIVGPTGRTLHGRLVVVR